VKNGLPRLLVGYVSMILCGSALAQDGSAVLRGEVQTDDPLGGYVVELHGLHDRSKAAVTDVGLDGSFVFHDLSCGDYEIELFDGFGNVLYDNFVSVSKPSNPVVVALPKREVNRPPSGAVPVDQLLHPISTKARRLVIAAQRLSEASDHRGAAEKLERALRISPECAIAHTNLAVQHIHLGRYRQALDELMRAGQLTQPTALMLGDMAYAEAGLGQRAEAIQSARKALDLDPAYGPAHYMLGALLARDPSTLREAIPHLERAVQTLDGARVTLEQARRNLSEQNTAHP